jgi:hypothetical protein
MESLAVVSHPLQAKLIVASRCLLIKALAAVALCQGSKCL